MEIIKYFLSPIIVGIFMFILNKNQKKRDTRTELQTREFLEKEKKHNQAHNMQTEGLLLLVDSSGLALKSLKKLRDEKGKALLNGEVVAFERDICEFKKKFETFIIEK